MTTLHPYFRIWLCGSFRVERSSNDGYQPVRTSEWGGSNHPRLLLKALLCCPGRQARREALIEMLWPDADTEQGAQNLNTATTKLRTVLRPTKDQESLLTTENDAAVYRLANQQALWIDTDAALTLLKEIEQQGRTLPETLSWLERAGEYFGAGMFLQDEEGLWVAGRRATIEQARYRSRLWLAEAYEQQGMPGQAEIVLSALLEEYMLDEDVHCRLMGLLHRQGMTHQALRLYESMRNVFSKEGVELTEATKMLAKRLQEQRHHLAVDPMIAGELLASSPEHSSLILQARAGNGTELAHMVQLLPMQQTAMPTTIFHEQGLLLSPEGGMNLPLALSVQTPSLEATSLDVATWFGARVNDLKAFGTFQHRMAFSCQQQQVLVYAELKRWDTMTDQNNHTTDEYSITRRMALTTLATLSTSLLTKVQFGPLTTFVIEEFLAQVATSITTCWSLLNGDNIASVEYSLPKYLPLLVALAQRSSAYQTRVAYLASQGCLLMDLLAYHRFHFKQSLAYAQQAVELAQVSGDRNLHAYALILLGGAFDLNGQQDMMLKKHQEAESYREEIMPPLQSYVLAELAYAYARNGHVQEALRSISKAREFFPEEFGTIPPFIAADYGLFQLTLFEGNTYLALGESDKNHKLQYSKQASVALAQIDKLSSTLIIPQRSSIEITNLQTTAMIGEKNLDKFETYLLLGARGARALGSEKRRQEIITNWKAAREQWPHEKRILQLADVVV